ncbi:5383_t:CDS:2, partial [Acaulospora colombiana]
SNHKYPTVAELSTGNLDGYPKYDWVHPGQGMVIDRIDRGWSPIETLKEALSAYAILNEIWHIDPLRAEKEASKDIALSTQDYHEKIFHVTWQMTVNKYINRKIPDCTPLLSMRVTQFPSRTWDCAPWLPDSITHPENGTWNPAPWLKWKNVTESMNDDWGISVVGRPVGEFRIEYGRYTNSTAELVLDDGPTKGSLRLKASAIKKIAQIKFGRSFGDGSGEVMRLLKLIIQLQKEYDISAIVILLLRAAEYTLRHRVQGGAEDKYFASARAALGNGNTRQVLEYLCFMQLRDGNAFSTGLREVFNGWDRWLVITEDNRAYLTWFPWGTQIDRLSKCHLIWTCPGHNEWALLGEPTPEAGQYRK